MSTEPRTAGFASHCAAWSPKSGTAAWWALRPDKELPLSTGFACQKGIAFTEVVNDPDRFTMPLRRRPDGSFEEVGWDQAMNDIADRLSAIHRRYGSGAVGWYFGNPGAFSYSHLMAVLIFVNGLGLGTHLHTASSQDPHSRLMASQLLYGIPSAVPIPDLNRTDLLVVVGANPVVSHGSILTAPRIRERMHAVVKRGGRVIVIGPRKTETAEQFEWLGIAGRLGTLTSYLVDAVNLVAGNVDVPGGSVFGSFGVPGESWAFTALGALLRFDHRRNRSRVGGFGNLIRTEPATMMTAEKSRRATGRVGHCSSAPATRCCRCPTAPNSAMRWPSWSCPSGSISTSPRPRRGATTYCRSPPCTSATTSRCCSSRSMPTPFRQATEAVVPPPGQVRTEWEIVDDLMRRMATRSPGFAALAVARISAGLLGRRLSPRLLADTFIRVGRGGDWFGLRRGGLSFRGLAERHPHGVVLDPQLRTGVLRGAVAYPDRRIRLQHQEIAAQIEELRGREDPVGYPLRLIGMRDARSENSWLHNAPLLMRGDRRPRALMHADDARQRGISDGGEVAVRSPFGKIALPARLTEDIVAGTVAIPHGWGHRGGGWRVANAAGGVNVNDLTSDDPDDVEALSGMAWLTGVPIEVERT